MQSQFKFIPIFMETFGNGAQNENRDPPTVLLIEKFGFFLWKTDNPIE